MRALHQPFHRGEQTARQREGGERGEQRGEGDNQPAGPALLAVKVDVGVARQALHRRGDNPADGRVIHFNRPTGAVRRYRRARANQGAHVLVDHPELGAPAVRRHARARTVVTGIVLQRAQDLENKAVVIAQKTPVAVLGVLFTQRIA